MSWFIVYLWSISFAVNNILGLASIFLILGNIILAGAYIYSKYYDDVPLHTKRELPRVLKKVTITTFTVTFLWLLIPPKDDIPIIYTLPKVANSEFVEDLPKDAKEIYDLGIEKIKSELKPKQIKLETNKEGEKE
jgi:hypothetical protein